MTSNQLLFFYFSIGLAWSSTASLEEESEDYYSIHDTDIKIPGRHMPKRPYKYQTLEDIPSTTPEHKQMGIAYDFTPRSHNKYENGYKVLESRYQNEHTELKSRTLHENKYNDLKSRYQNKNTDLKSRTLHENKYNGLDSRYQNEHTSLNEHNGLKSLPLNDQVQEKDGPSPSEGKNRLLNGPRFDRNLTRHVRLPVGKTAKLYCRVEQVTKEASVSWIRVKDLHILTVGSYKYSTDKRISITYVTKDNGWLLKIKKAQVSDAGKYECQVSTKPVLSFIISLDILDSQEDLRNKVRNDATFVELPSYNPHLINSVPKVFIVNSPDIHVHRGSIINLTCVINHDTTQLQYVYWYHNNNLIDMDSGRHIVRLDSKGRRTFSHLIVRRARREDSGRYTCEPSTGHQAKVHLHVLNGELRAAMQGNSSLQGQSPSSAILLIGVAYILRNL